MHITLTEVKDFYDSKKSRYLMVQEGIDLLRLIDKNLSIPSTGVLLDIDDKIKSKIALHIIKSILLEEEYSMEDIFNQFVKKEELEEDDDDDDADDEVSSDDTQDISDEFDLIKKLKKD